ncbi:MAG: PrgI family protein [Oscillospiraceae bacterium]|nr:PrgI family protein [Oscillospiraceae bacterium]
MEIRINKEIRQYTESVFFGLSARQFFFSALAVGAALLSYFLFQPVLGSGNVSWLCILTAVPFAILGFFRYHGMNAEQFLITWLRSEVLGPKRLLFHPTNLYYECLKDTLFQQEKERRKRDEKKNKDKGKHPYPEEDPGPHSCPEDLDRRNLPVREGDLLQELELPGHQLQDGGGHGQEEDL